MKRGGKREKKRKEKVSQERDDRAREQTQTGVRTNRTDAGSVISFGL